MNSNSGLKLIEFSLRAPYFISSCSSSSFLTSFTCDRWCRLGSFSHSLHQASYLCTSHIDRIWHVRYGHCNLHVCCTVLGSFSKTRRRRQWQRHQTKGLMSKTIAVHLRFEFLYISLLSSTNQRRELTKSYVFWRTWTAMANFTHLLSESNAFGACLARASF